MSDSPVDAILTPFDAPKPKRKMSRLVRVLMVRVMGALCLFAFYEAVTGVVNGGYSPLVDFGAGMLGLVVLFMGIFMAFGKIEVKTEDNEKIATASSVAEAWDMGYDKGYQTAVEDREEDEMNPDTGPAKIPDRAPDEVG